MTKYLPAFVLSVFAPANAVGAEVQRIAFAHVERSAATMSFQARSVVTTDNLAYQVTDATFTIAVKTPLGLSASQISYDTRTGETTLRGGARIDFDGCTIAGDHLVMTRGENDEIKVVSVGSASFDRKRSD